MVITLLVTIMVFLLSFVCLDNWIITLILSVITFLYSFLYATKLLKNYKIKIAKSRDCSNLINTIIISLSSSNSLESAYNDATINVSKDLEKELVKCNSDNTWENLQNLSNYFNFFKYTVFLNLLNIFINNGGNILEMTSVLRDEIDREDKCTNTIALINSRKVREFLTLWGFSILIILFCRFGLANVYEMMRTNNIFSYGILAFIIFLLLSFHFLLLNIYKSIRSIY